MSKWLVQEVLQQKAIPEADWQVESKTVWRVIQSIWHEPWQEPH
jgi:hypothetical protein